MSSQIWSRAGWGWAMRQLLELMTSQVAVLALWRVWQSRYWDVQALSLLPFPCSFSIQAFISWGGIEVGTITEELDPSSQVTMTLFPPNCRSSWNTLIFMIFMGYCTQRNGDYPAWRCWVFRRGQRSQMLQITNWARSFALYSFDDNYRIILIIDEAYPLRVGV